MLLVDVRRISWLHTALALSAAKNNIRKIAKTLSFFLLEGFELSSNEDRGYWCVYPLSYWATAAYNGADSPGWVSAALACLRPVSLPYPSKSRKNEAASRVLHTHAFLFGYNFRSAHPFATGLHAQKRTQERRRDCGCGSQQPETPSGASCFCWPGQE